MGARCWFAGLVCLLLMAAVTACAAVDAAQADHWTNPQPSENTKEKAAAAVSQRPPGISLSWVSKEFETITGGPAPGAKVKGTLTTTAEASSDPDTYTVTLTKNWNVSVNGKKLMGYWKYKVTPQTVQLVESEDNTDLIRIVK
jgi:ABC-type glycerol-3-phosphate transport system substrate-binding protein